jgi:uncharacterized protein YxjI
VKSFLRRTSKVSVDSVEDDGPIWMDEYSLVSRLSSRLVAISLSRCLNITLFIYVLWVRLYGGEADLVTRQMIVLDALCFRNGGKSVLGSVCLDHN